MSCTSCVCVHLQQEVHEAAVGLHLVLQLVEDDEGGERKAGALCMKRTETNMFLTTARKLFFLEPCQDCLLTPSLPVTHHQGRTRPSGGRRPGSRPPGPG